MHVCVFQLILPECMKLLPVYLNCVLKSDVLLPGGDVSLDDRAYLRQLISGMDVTESHVFFYPRLLPLVRPHTQTQWITSGVGWFCSVQKSTLSVCVCYMVSTALLDIIIASVFKTYMHNHLVIIVKTMMILFFLHSF